VCLYAVGECRIKGLLHADDTHVCLDALHQLGVTFAWEDDGQTLRVVGTGGTSDYSTVSSCMCTSEDISECLVRIRRSFQSAVEGSLSGQCRHGVALSHDHVHAHHRRQHRHYRHIHFSSFCDSFVRMLTTTGAGVERLKERPIKDLTDALTENGCRIRFPEKAGFFPFEIEGTGLAGGHIRLSANVSSQFVSSILMSAPYATHTHTHTHTHYLFYDYS
jgi:pentafunctional AROM polypeptide